MAIDPSRPVYLKRMVIDPNNKNCFPVLSRPYRPGELPKEFLTEEYCSHEPPVDLSDLGKAILSTVPPARVFTTEERREMLGMVPRFGVTTKQAGKALSAIAGAGISVEDLEPKVMHPELLQLWDEEFAWRQEFKEKHGYFPGDRAIPESRKPNKMPPPTKGKSIWFD